MLVRLHHDINVCMRERAPIESAGTPGVFSLQSSKLQHAEMIFSRPRLIYVIHRPLYHSDKQRELAE